MNKLAIARVFPRKPPAVVDLERTVRLPAALAPHVFDKAARILSVAVPEGAAFCAFVDISGVVITEVRL